MDFDIDVADSERVLSGADEIANQPQSLDKALEPIRDNSEHMRCVCEHALHQGQARFKEMLLDTVQNYSIEIMCDMAHEDSVEKVLGEDLVKFAQATKKLFDLMCEFDEIGHM